jgi:hypothetical protein
MSYKTGLLAYAGIKLYLFVALERGEHRNTIAYVVAVGVAAPLPVAAIASEEVLARPVRRLVARAAAATPGAIPPSIMTAAAASSSSNVGVAPDVLPGSSAALGRRRRLGLLAVKEGAGEAIAPPLAPEGADLPVGRRRRDSGARTQALVHALVAEPPVGLNVHGRPRIFAAAGSRADGSRGSDAARARRSSWGLGRSGSVRKGSMARPPDSWVGFSSRRRGRNGRSDSDSGFLIGFCAFKKAHRKNYKKLMDSAVALRLHPFELENWFLVSIKWSLYLDLKLLIFRWI